MNTRQKHQVQSQEDRAFALLLSSCGLTGIFRRVAETATMNVSACERMKRESSAHADDWDYFVAVWQEIVKAGEDGEHAAKEVREAMQRLAAKMATGGN